MTNEPDQIIDAAMAYGLHTDACRAHPLVGWIVMRDLPHYPDEFVARLVTNAPTSYVLLADTLAGIHAQLPDGLIQMKRQPGDPPAVVDMWFSHKPPGTSTSG